MDNFIVSARKYRPASFDMVIGQESITRTLKSAIRNNKLAHAYLFCGPRGVGKTTCARIFAKTINCSNLSSDSEACDQCESCISFNTLRSFNIHELDAASNNKVEDIRSLNEQVRIPPQVGKYSIYIIDEVHMLSSSAFNAFLKTLEEPPAHAIFILATTEKHKIIPTILSRCQIFDFNRIRIEDIVARLMFVAKQEGINAEEEALHVIGQKADGAMRDALSIFDQIASINGKTVSYKDVIENLNVLDFEYYFRTVDGALLADVSSVLLTFNEVLEKGFDGNNFISGLNSHLRDLLVCKDEVTLKLLEATPSIKQRYIQQTSRCSADFLFRALEIGNNCDLTYKNSRNPRLNVELALLKICSLSNASSVEAEKKKPEQLIPEKPEAEEKAVINEPEKIIIHKEKSAPLSNGSPAKHTPVVEKPSKSFSIKDLLSDEKPKEILDTTVVNKHSSQAAEEFTPEAFQAAWQEYTDGLTGEGTRIVSMFKSIKTDFESESLIRIHLNNAAQKDLFILNYKQNLLNFLQARFSVPALDIETLVDYSETNNILYTDNQKADYLIGKYPALSEMKKMFNLDIP
ncbi:MAG TPA: DNA polymerase III subunit gamma/tau [Bacteroidales bacterium]|nr:DNA polymerase III subunit gamma/tau [Bacteroidales bacterium]